MYTKSLFLITLFALTACGGCSTFSPESLGVNADDNAFQCIRVELDGYFTDSNAGTVRFEAPGNLTIKDLSPEQIMALDAMAERMGC